MPYFGTSLAAEVLDLGRCNVPWVIFGPGETRCTRQDSNDPAKQGRVLLTVYATMGSRGAPRRGESIWLDPLPA
jgi:hypothetical protein